jgi:exopolysaccharide biosynthesis polyprenyl glycosylphosphotransferase
VLYRIEWNVARHHPGKNRVLILGTDHVAAHLQRTFRREPMLRSRVTAFLRTDLTEPDADIAPDLIKGTVEELAAFIEAEQVDQVVLTSAGIPHERIVDIILLCERNLITFNMVPDLFRVLTGSMDVQSLDDIPLLGVARWPLDLFWNRAAKRMEDIVGGLVGLILSAPVIAVAAVCIKRGSPGPVFFGQERCGESGRTFTLYKLRTMRADAEESSGPVFTVAGDPRVTPAGAFLRSRNLDELPQFWNVLKGEMSLVGPRPERPHFVEQFKGDVGSYMWRHVSKPGLTGWAQVNGLRGNTSISERIKYDLYYLEHWSLAFDFKILAKTFFARRNAY